MHQIGGGETIKEQLPFAAHEKSSAIINPKMITSRWLVADWMEAGREKPVKPLTALATRVPCDYWRVVSPKEFASGSRRESNISGIKGI